MADGTIKIDTEIDKSGLDKGTKNVSKAFSNLGKVVKGAGITAVIATSVKAMKDLYKVVMDTSQAYNVQLKAETLLKTSAKNNPYLNGDSVKQLKDFASYLQSISTYGDEQLIPMMANLANSGRTQAQIMDIMSAAVDVASTGVVSLESAVQGLNLSYTGQIGTLGRAVPALKSLTDEQLKNGDAVKFVKNQYAGMAEETTKATGSYEQMKNAAGDFKEAVGQITKPAADSWNIFWKNWYESGIEQVNKLNAKLQEINDRANFDKYRYTVNSKMKGKSSDQVANEWSESQLTDLIRFYSNNSDKLNNHEIDYLATMLEARSKIQAKNKVDEEHAKKQLALEQKQAELAEKTAQVEQSVADYKTSNQSALDQKLKEIETEYNLQKQLGETTDENAMEQEKLNAMIESYVSLIADSNGQVTEENDLAKTRLKQIQEQTKKVKELGKVIEQTDWSKIEDIFSKISDAVENLASAATNMTDMLTENVEANAEVDTATAEKEYAEGLISYEEYCAKKEQISKDAAEKEYEIEMWSWGIQLLQAQASTALSMIQTLADTTITSTAAKIAMMATVGALGATQLASIIASKPTKNFTNGGFVGGTSYTGDSIHAGLNSGELVANRQQQAALWRAMNGGGAGGFSQSITIENNAADSVSVGQSVSEDKLIFTVNKIVNSEMKRGTYTGSMLEANSKVNGVKYL